MVFNQAAARRIYRQLLAARGMTTKQVAESVGVVPATIYNWLRDTEPTNLGRGTLKKIADVFGIDVEQMFYYSVDDALAPEEQARQRALRQIDELLAGIDDPAELARAANIILATLRATRDEFERRRAAPTGARKAAISAVPSSTARHPRADG